MSEMLDRCAQRYVEGRLPVPVSLVFENLLATDLDAQQSLVRAAPAVLPSPRVRQTVKQRLQAEQRRRLLAGRALIIGAALATLVMVLAHIGSGTGQPNGSLPAIPASVDAGDAIEFGNDPEPMGLNSSSALLFC